MISILVPTRNRLPRLKRMIDSVINTSCWENELIFRVDEDDVLTREWFEHRNYKVLIGPRKNGYASLPSFFNDMVKIAQGSIIMCCNDDAVFRTENWDEKIEAKAEQFPDGIYNIGVATKVNEQVFPFSIVSRRLTEILGFINDERLLYSDLFLRDVCNSFGRCIFMQDVVIEHDWAGRTPDKTRHEAQQHENTVWAAYKKFTPEYERLHNQCVNEAIERIGHEKNKEIAKDEVVG